MAKLLDVFINNIGVDLSLPEIYSLCQGSSVRPELRELCQSNLFWQRLIQAKLPNFWQYLQAAGITEVTSHLKKVMELLYLFNQYFQRHNFYPVNWDINVSNLTNQYFPKLVNQLQIAPGSDYNITGRLTKTAAGGYLLVYKPTYFHPNLDPLVGPKMEIFIEPDQWNDFIVGIMESLTAVEIPSPQNTDARVIWEKLVNLNN